METIYKPIAIVGTITIALIGAFGYIFGIVGDYFANTFHGSFIEGYGSSLAFLGHSMIGFVIAVIVIAILIALAIISENRW